MESIENTSVNSNEGMEQETTKTYTEEEVRELLQREGDKRVSSALKKAQKDFDKKLSLSKLDEAERTQAEKQSRIEELEAQLAQYEIEKNKSELKSVLSSRGLSAEFADLIEIGEDLEEAQARIDTLDRLFKAAVAAEVKTRLAQGKPSVGTGVSEELTAETFKKMSLADRNKLYNEKPELFRKLSGN